MDGVRLDQVWLDLEMATEGVDELVGGVWEVPVAKPDASTNMPAAAESSGP